jgi:hypothetical protein
MPFPLPQTFSNAPSLRENLTPVSPRSRLQNMRFYVWYVENLGAA